MNLPSRVPSTDLNHARLQSNGWCFAFAAADLFSYKTGTDVSATAIAAAYYHHAPVIERSLSKTLQNYGESIWSHKSIKTSDKEGGHITRVLRTVIDDGFVCAENGVRSQFGNIGDVSIDVYLEMMDKIEAAYWDLDDMDLEDFDDPSFTSTKAVQDGCIKNETLQASRIIFPGLELKDLVRVAQRSSRETFFYDLTRWGCKATRIPRGKQKYQTRRVDLMNREDADEKSAGDAGVKAIHEQLSKGNPVIISYSQNGLFDPAFSYRSMIRNNRPNPSEIDHASSVMGRRWNPSKQECEYQIKNSWGTDCSLYSPAYECKYGLIWASESQISDFVGEVTWLE